MTITRTILFALLLTLPFTSCQSGGSTSTLELASEIEKGEPGGEEECAFTQGYWKNHPEAWPVSSLKLGSITYSKSELLVILKTPVQGNGLVSLAHQLIAAKLNAANGADDSDIDDAIDDADALIGGLEIPPYGGGYLHPSATSSLTGELDEFNNTGECGDAPPVCGDGKVEGDEECDDGDDIDDNGCSNDCKLPVCGNGKIEGDEECDDGDDIDDNECTNDCKLCIP